MTNGSDDKQNEISDRAEDEAAPTASSFAFNPDEYREYLDEYDMTEEEQNAFLAELWKTMSAFVDLAWGVDSVQLISPVITDAMHEKAGQDSGKTVDSKDTPRSPFNAAAQGSAAGKGHDNE